MHVYLITGASKGIGFALGKQLMKEDHFLICIARTKNEELIQLAKEKGGHVIFLEYDLAKIEGLHGLMDAVIDHMPNQYSSVTLINNAGVIDPIGRTEDNSPDAIKRSIDVNLTAPMVLSSAFIKRFKNNEIPKKIINISSGAGRNPYTGWSSYCAGKAGLDHYTRVVSDEQRNELHGVKIISIAPGIIDTGMQKKIRETDEKDFEHLDRFVEYKEHGLLSSPDETARKLIQVIDSKTFYKLDAIVDLRDF